MASNSQEKTVFESTTAPFAAGFKILFSIGLMWFFSMAIHIGYVRYFKLDPAQHLEAQIGYFVDKAPSKTFVENVATNAYWLVFEATSAQRLLTKPVDLVTPTSPDQSNVGKYVKRGFWSAFQPDLVVVSYATVLFGVKVAMLAMLAPLFFLLMFAAGADGLVQRYVRRACGGHESASVYHRAKKFGFMLLPPFAVVTFLCSPIAFDPAWLFIPTAFISAWLLRLQLTYYKKYL